MKTLITILAALTLATTAHAQKSITSLLFDPPASTGIVFWQDGAFSGSTTMSIAELPQAQAAGIQAALGWLETQMPAGTTGLVRVVLQRTVDGDGAVQFAIETLATNGESGANVRTASVDGADEDSINALWLSLEQSISGEMPVL
jgi:hypothetical protein